MDDKEDLLEGRVKFDNLKEDLSTRDELREMVHGDIHVELPGAVPAYTGTDRPVTKPKEM